MKQLVKREFLKFGSVLRVSAFMLLCGLPLWFCSCEKGIPDQGTGNGNVGLQFVLGSSSYDPDTSESRSYGEPAPEPETVVVPVGDGLFLHATLEPDRSDPLRASEAIPNNTLVMIVAYKSDGSYESSAEYRVSGSGLVPTAGNGRGLEVSGNDTYTFAAYSINSTVSVPAYSATVTIPANSDLLYEKSTPTPVNAGSTKISINLKHKFSLVKVSVTATSNITTLTSVSMNPVYSSVEMQVSDGTLDNPSGSASQPFRFPALNSTQVTSSDTIVYTAGQAFNINVGSIATASSGASNSASVAFTHTALSSGKKYTLQLTFSTVKFAASNIYWDGSQLTFDEYMANPPASSMQKQGVFFKFGSLVGISAGRTDGAGFFGNAFVFGTSADSTGATSTRLFVPYHKNNKEYLAGTNLTEKVWTQTNAGARNWLAWAAIPYYDTGYYTGTGDRADNSVIVGSYNTEANWQQWKGDICQFINHDYRLPYSYEFGNGGGVPWATNNNGWTPSVPLLPTPSEWDTDTALGSVNGTASILTGATNDATGYFFPASGERIVRTYQNTPYEGALISVRNIGIYKTGSIHTTMVGIHMYFAGSGGSGAFYPGNGYSLVDTATPVRCVKK